MTRPMQVRVRGPLLPYAESFRAELAEQGYTPLSAANQVRLLAHVSRWLESRRLQLCEFTSERVVEFLKERRHAGYTAWLSKRGLVPLLSYLRRLGAMPVPPPPASSTDLDRLLDHYGDYLRHERGLVAETIRSRQSVARRFLTECSRSDKLELDRLTAADVTQFVLRESRRHCVGTAKLLVSDLRSLLRYLYLQGRIPTPLAAAVPAVAGWRLSALPRAIEPEQVTRLLRSCNRRTALGRRDYANLILLVRLGLRAGEVAALELDDLDWRRGEIIVRGKGRQQDRLPLPVDVGQALATYLRHGRPRIDCRKVFLRGRAPQGALSRSAITAMVMQASSRAGGPRIGPHRLRHTAATEMLRCGGSLPEIAQLLRHRSLLTTAIYAKVDRTALRALAQPWPGAAR